MIPVKWVTQDEIDRNKHNLSQWNGEPRMVPVVEFSALEEVMKGLKRVQFLDGYNGQQIWHEARTIIDQIVSQLERMK